MKLIASKLPVSLIESKVQYALPHDNTALILNDIIGKPIEIIHTGNLFCIDCGKKVPKFYAPGLCFLCSKTSVMAAECIINPELCEAHLGKGRDPEWEQLHHNRPHIVYLANSGGLKVGVTRTDQIPTRWIDQGADEAIILALTPYRQLAGEIEVFLKQYLSDKTNWRIMLRNQKVLDINLLTEKKIYAEKLGEKYQQYIAEDNTIYQLLFPSPVLTQTVKSHKMDNNTSLKGTLTGIKAQYLIIDDSIVFNIRSHAGYELIIDI